MSAALGAPWVEKYRPESFDDIISHEDIISTLMVFTEKGQLPHLLFHGPPGTGKTSTILAVSRFLYGSHRNSYVMELNASDDRGIETVREQIKTFSETSNSFSTGVVGSESGPRTNLKLIILDEADQMTNAAQNSLRRIMEIYSSNVTAMSLGSTPGKVIDSEAVLATAGLPKLSEVNDLLQRLMQDPFKACVEHVTSLHQAQGYSVEDIVMALYRAILRIDWPNVVVVQLLIRLADIEQRLSAGASPYIQIASIVSAFTEARFEIERLKFDLNFK
ncbi:replication factor C3 [Babesia ovata]|uniref:Replication factor C3 n=1 Tax=Babesia ovata TaxID=189622 RepID=A0A2H6KFB4_9APIC|nr:replication factor C3 [Babesia ovata]GBE61690.1 replication factor C3 [Babesia ovata]